MTAICVPVFGTGCGLARDLLALAGGCGNRRSSRVCGCIRTGRVGCLFVALAAPFAFAPIGLVMRLFEPSETDCDPCGLGFASVLVLLSAAATVGIWLGDAVALSVLHRRAISD
jgi:hypothetical protein